MSEYPILIARQCGGWLAKGDGWAVDGPTGEEAIIRYREAERRHAIIDAQPFFYERLCRDNVAAARLQAEDARTGSGAPTHTGGHGAASEGKGL